MIDLGPRAPCAALVLVLAASLAACSSPANDATVSVVGPSFSDFVPLPASAGEMATPGVGDALARRCGSLDCHGAVGRNLRIFSNVGARLDPKAIVGLDNDNVTTPDEYAYSYRSLVALEPEIMAAVVASSGAQPTRLTFVRKSRGMEKHKGGTIASTTDPLDRCMTTWLAGATDRRACTSGMTPP